MKSRFKVLVSLLVLMWAGTLWAQYGVGITLDVPHVDAGTLTLDGVADETAWTTAKSVDILNVWDGSWSDPAHPVPDIEVDARLLWTEDTLFVYVGVEDYETFYWGTEGNPWGGEQITVSVDATHAGDDSVDTAYAGWPELAPDLGPTAYKIWKEGITTNWGYVDTARGILDGIFPVDSGWVAGTVLVDEEAFTWSVEMAVVLDEIVENGEIGFNVGGATASQTWADNNPWEEGDGAHAFYAWQGGFGGALYYEAISFGTLKLYAPEFPLSIAEERPAVPKQYLLKQNYPNPFNPTTTIVYQVPERAHVVLNVYNMLGQRVARLVNEERPAGQHQLTWNASGVASGIYFYRLSINGRAVQTRKALLIR